MLLNGIPIKRTFSPTLINGCQLWLEADRVRIGAAQFVAVRSESLSNATAIVTSGSMSVEAWVYLDSISADMVIFDQGTAAASKQLLRVESVDSKVYFSMDGGVTNSLSAALSTGVWYHVVGTYDGTNQKLYVNGVLVDTDAVTVDYAGVDRFAIGSTTPGASYMNGRICLVRVWSKEVVQAEVTSLYNSGRGLSHAQLSGTLLTLLVDSYNLSEASGNRADSAGAKTLTDNNTVMAAPGIIPVIPADGAAIGIWDDLSGNGNHATQATEANMPLVKTGIQAGKPVLRFDGINDALSNTGLSALAALTILAVFQTPTAAGNFVWVHQNVALNPFGLWDSSRWYVRDATNDIAKSIDVNPGGSTSSQMLTGAYDDATKGGQSWRNGASLGTGTVTGNLAAGGNGYAVGHREGISVTDADIALILVYNRVLNAGELSRLHRWAGRKYGIGVS